MKRIILGVALVILFSAGCSKCILIRSEYFDITGEVFMPKTQEDVQILTEVPDRPYREIGMVKVLAKRGTSMEVINKELKMRAARAGADAVIGVQYGEDRANEFLMCGLFTSTKRNICVVGRSVVFTPLEHALTGFTPQEPTAEGD